MHITVFTIDTKRETIPEPPMTQPCFMAQVFDAKLFDRLFGRQNVEKIFFLDARIFFEMR